MKNGIKCTQIYQLSIVQVNLFPLFDGTADFPVKKNATDLICTKFQKSTSHGQTSAVPADQVIPAQANRF